MGKKMNENTLSLPPHYNIERTIDLAQDKHLNVLIQSCFVLITGILIGLALWAGLPLSSTLNPFLSFFITVVLKILLFPFRCIYKVYKGIVCICRFV